MLGTLPPQSDVPTGRPKSGRGLLILLFILAALGGGIVLGKQVFSSSSVIAKTTSDSGLNFSLFDQVYQSIKQKYVDQPKSNTGLEYGAIKGLVAGLGDPNSNFMDPDETKAFQENLDGKFSGIGVELAVKDKALTIVAPLPSSPGDKAGLKAGDIILAIDGVNTSTLTLDAAVQKIRGPEGSEVALLVARKGEFDGKSFKVKREQIDVKSVTNSVREDGIGIIDIARFGEDTASLVGKAAAEFTSKHVKGIVLDLRGNPGGFLEASVDVAGNFLAKDQVIVSEEFGDGSKQEYRSSGTATLKDIPLVVLVDEGSASAAEILAGALRDYGRAKLVGTKTFGKGSVQELQSLSQGTSLRLTVAKWVMPKGGKIDHVGIEPDVKVEITQADLDAHKEPQLDKALELVKQK